MATSVSTRSLIALVLALGACSGEDAKRSIDTEQDSGSEADAGSEPAPEPEADAGTAPASDTVPLTVWVDDLVDHHTTDEAEPDTVEDKKISDDTDESSFDKYLQ